MTRVHADRQVCVGAGNCVWTAPELFDQDDATGLVVVRQVEPPAVLESQLRQAVDLCPSGALTLSE